MKFATSIYYLIFLVEKIPYELNIYIHSKIFKFIFNVDYLFISNNNTIDLYNYYKNNTNELEIIIKEWI